MHTVAHAFRILKAVGTATACHPEHQYRRVVWVGGGAGAAQPPSYSVHFVDIMMHALASPSEDFSRHSIYMQLDGAQPADDEDGDDRGPPEVRLVPAESSQSAHDDQHVFTYIQGTVLMCRCTLPMCWSPGQAVIRLAVLNLAAPTEQRSLPCPTAVSMVYAVEAIFQALCEGALANPDPDAEDDEGEFFYDEVRIPGVYHLLDHNHASHVSARVMIWHHRPAPR